MSDPCACGCGHFDDGEKPETVTFEVAPKAVRKVVVTKELKKILTSEIWGIPLSPDDESLPPLLEFGVFDENDRLLSHEATKALPLGSTVRVVCAVNDVLILPTMAGWRKLDAAVDLLGAFLTEAGKPTKAAPKPKAVKPKNPKPKAAKRKAAKKAKKPGTRA